MMQSFKKIVRAISEIFQDGLMDQRTDGLKRTITMDPRVNKGSNMYVSFFQNGVFYYSIVENFLFVTVFMKVVLGNV